MTDNALDGWKAQPQRALDLVDSFMRDRYRDRGVDMTMEIHDLAISGMTHADVMNFADQLDLGGDLGQDIVHLRSSFGRSFVTGLVVGLQRLDVSLDLDARSELLAHR